MTTEFDQPGTDRLARAQAIADAGGFEAARQNGTLRRRIDTTLAEALVLGLLRQDVRLFFSVLGHGSTQIGDVLRIYQAAGLVRIRGVRNEIEASYGTAARAKHRRSPPPRRAFLFADADEHPAGSFASHQPRRAAGCQCPDLGTESGGEGRRWRQAGWQRVAGVPATGRRRSRHQSPRL